MKKSLKSKGSEPTFKEQITLHLPDDGYWKEKIQSTNQIQTQLKKLNNALQKFNTDINANLFFEIKKHFKSYRFVYKLKLEGVNNNKFFTEKTSDNYIRPLNEAVKQSIHYLNKHSDRKR